MANFETDTEEFYHKYVLKNILKNKLCALAHFGSWVQFGVNPYLDLGITREIFIIRRHLIERQDKKGSAGLLFLLKTNFLIGFCVERNSYIPVWWVLNQQQGRNCHKHTNLSFSISPDKEKSNIIGSNKGIITNTVTRTVTECSQNVVRM